MAHYPSDPYQRHAANRDCEEEALGWVVRFSSGDATDDDRREFDHWVADAANLVAYRRARRLWLGLRDPLLSLPVSDLEYGQAAEMPISRSLPLPVVGRPSDTRRGPRRPQRRRGAMAAAALVVGLSIGSAYYLQIGRFDIVSNPMSIARERLPDGSTVAVAPGTAMNTMFERGARHVALARGEAFFKVRRDTAHPFVVSAGYGLVRVLGTAFSVRYDDAGKVSVIVREGRVEVKSGERMAILTSNQRVSFRADGLGRVEPVAADRVTAWTNGRLVMADQPLARVVEEINRYGNRRVVLLNEEAGRRRVDAVVELRQIDNWLIALSASQGLYRTRFGPITVLR
jgi:transmembrane sensor